MAQLYRVGNPIDREERANLNLTLDDIQSRFSLLQSQVNFLAGGADTEALIQEIRQAIADAEQATDDVNEAILLIDDKIIELEEEINKAKDLTGKGEWNSTTDYLKNNIVTKDGNSYLALSDNTNVPVTNTSTWMLLAAKGDTGKGLTILGKLNTPSQLPPASGFEEGSAYYVGQDLYVIIEGDWENVGQIKGDKGEPGEDGSDANVTTANIESALGYTPANQSLLSSFKGQYEFRTATIFGRQIRITKPDASNRIPILLNTDFSQGDPITISLDSGSTSMSLKNVDGTDVTRLDKGLIELVQTGSFFTLRSSGIPASKIEELASIIGEPAVATDDFDTLLSKFQDGKDLLAANITSKGVTASGDEALEDLSVKVSEIDNGGMPFLTGISNSSASMNFQVFGGTQNQNLPYIEVSGLSFKPKLIEIAPTIYVATSGITTYNEELSGLNEICHVYTFSQINNTAATVRGIKGNFGNAYVNETGFRLPVFENNREYTWKAYG